MDTEREKPWRRNVSNVLVVNSIFAAISAIIVQTMVTSDKIYYGLLWLIFAVTSLVLFVVSTEQLGESILEDDVNLYIRSSISYNFGVLFLFLDLGRIVWMYGDTSASVTVMIFACLTLIWLCLWGRDSLFLVMRGDHFKKWKAHLEGQAVDGEILDHWDRVRVWIRATRHSDRDQ